MNHAATLMFHMSCLEARLARPLTWGSGPESSLPQAWGGSRGVLLTGYLRRIDRRIRLSINRRLAPYGLTLSQAVVIALLHDAGAEHIYQKDLERELELTNPTVTSLIKTMVGRGLVRRVQEQHDGRYYRLSLTDAGDALYETVAKELLRGNAIFEERLSEDELDELELLFKKLLVE